MASGNRRNSMLRVRSGLVSLSDICFSQYRVISVKKLQTVVIRRRKSPIAETTKIRSTHTHTYFVRTLKNRRKVDFLVWNVSKSCSSAEQRTLFLLKLCRKRNYRTNNNFRTNRIIYILFIVILYNYTLAVSYGKKDILSSLSRERARARTTL